MASTSAPAPAHGSEPQLEWLLARLDALAPAAAEFKQLLSVLSYLEILKSHPRLDPSMVAIAEGLIA